MTAEAGLFKPLQDGVELVVGDVVHRHFREGMAEGDEGERIPLETQLHAEGGQGAENDSTDAAVDEDLGKLGTGISMVAQPVGFNPVTQFGGPGRNALDVAGEGEIFLPSVAGGEGGDEGEIADKLGFSGGAKVGHQGADHGMGCVAQLGGHFLDLLPHGGRDARIVPQGQGDGDFGDPAPLGDILECDPHSRIWKQRRAPAAS